jgi:hypothetical protein
LMSTIRASIVNHHILSQRSYRSLGNGLNVLGTSMMVVDDQVVFKLSENGE